MKIEAQPDFDETDLEFVTATAGKAFKSVYDFELKIIGLVSPNFLLDGGFSKGSSLITFSLVCFEYWYALEPAEEDKDELEPAEEGADELEDE